VSEIGGRKSLDVGTAREQRRSSEGADPTVQARLDEVEGRKLTFSVWAHDGVDEICRGTHQRFVIDTARFNSKVAQKLAAMR
jgi:fluoroacetyl-CoA thioesterase